jgi:hypothetical protein
MSAQQAKEYSLIDEIIQNLAEASTRVTVELASRLAELNSQGERLDTTASTLYPAIGGIVF